MVLILGGQSYGTIETEIWYQTTQLLDLPAAEAERIEKDVDQIVDTLTDRHGLDAAMEADDFWEVVLDHTLTPEPTRTVQEQVWPLVQAAMGRTAEWTSDEGVTVQITGMSPVKSMAPMA